MTEGQELLKKRFLELARRSDEGHYFSFTDFLGLAEQSALRECDLRGYRYRLFGGADGAERVIARFGDAEELGYEADFPISCLLISPRSEKFADKLTHRDFLGALLNLGIEREVLGDIVIRENRAYIFVLDNMAEYILGSLERVRRTDVRVTLAEGLPEGELYRTEKRNIQLSGERVDAVVAKTFSLSRDDAQSLITRRTVYVNGALCESVSYTPRLNDVISVRGKGRLIYRGVTGTTRKGKLSVTVEVYV